MKQPLYALLIAPNPEKRQAILEGTINTVVLGDDCDYDLPGKVMLCCHLKPWVVMAELANVTRKTLNSITEKEWKAAGFKNKNELLRSLQQNFHPNTSLHSEITVIRWHNLSGSLVEEIERQKALKQHYPQNCQCQDFAHGFIANDCHVHNENPRHFIGDENLPCDCHI